MQTDLVSSLVPTQFACGRDHTIISAGNRFYGFGNGSAGQFGQVKGLQLFPAAVLTFSSIRAEAASSESSSNIQVAVGNQHTLILKDGNVYSAGDNSSGRLGLWQSQGKTEGRILFGGAREDKISFVTCGPDHSIALSQDGVTCYTWGICDQRGVGHPLKTKQEMQQEWLSKRDSGTDEKSIELDFAPYLERPTEFTCWKYQPKEPHRLVQISCGPQHTLALREDGVVYSWGTGADGRLGHKGTESLLEPTAIKAFNKSEYEKVIAVCAGLSHSMALDLEGKVWTWGSCSYGKLGHGDLEKAMHAEYVPRQVQGLTVDSKEGVVSIHCNQYHSLAITNTHKLYIWGGNEYHRLGLGDSDNIDPPRNRWFPHQVPIGKVIRAACGLNHTVAVTETNEVYAWGQASSFRCGVDPPPSGHFNAPKKIAFFDGIGVYKYFKESNITFSSRQYTPLQIAAGETHSMALCEGNQLVSWGSNQYGQLGTGQQTHSDRPIPLGVFLESHHRVSQIGCGANHSLILTTGGTMWSWGDNQYGQLGLSHNQNARTPFQIKSLTTTDVISISVGANTCACVERFVERGHYTHRIYAWGDNRVGQAGLGPKTKKQNHPAQVDFPQSRRFDQLDIAIGTEHMLVLGKSYDREKPELIHKSRLYTVGRGSNGQLGVTTPANNIAYSLTKVQIFEGWSKVLAENNVIDAHRERRARRLIRLKKIADRNRRRAEKDKNYKRNPAAEAELEQQLAELSQETMNKDRVVTESDAEWEEELQLAGPEDEEEDEEGEEGTDATAILRRKKQAGDSYPHIQLVSAGEFGSVASVQRFHDKSMEFVFAWGKHPGLFQEKALDASGATSSTSAAPTTMTGVQDQLFPRLVTAFEGDNLKNELDSKQPIFDFRIKQICCARSHVLLLAVYNMLIHQPVVFAFGDTTFGKLGVGVVSKYLIDKQQQRRLMSSNSSSSNANESTDKKFLPPSKVPALSGNPPIVDQIATFSDHSLALSLTQGAVFAWGVVADGRLGLSDGNRNTLADRTVQEPQPLPAFVPLDGQDLARGGGAGASGSSISTGVGARSSVTSQPGGLGSGSAFGGPGAAGMRGSITGSVVPGAPGSFGPGSIVAPPGSEFGAASSIMGGAGSGSSSGGSISGGGFMNPLNRDGPIVYTKQMLQAREAEAKSQIAPLAKQYEAALALYNERRTNCDRQKDLLHMMILERLNESQSAPDSITKRQNVVRREREAEEKRLQIEDMKKAAVIAAGKRSWWQRLFGRGLDLSQLEKAKLNAGEEDDPSQKIRYAHSSELSTLEEAIGRLYLRPCLLYQFFQICGRAIEFKEHHIKESKPADVETEIQFIKQDGVDFIYSILDTYYERDVRLLQVFLRMMLEKHVQLNRSELILHEDKIEWLILSRAFMSGMMRRKLGDLLAEVISNLRDYDQSPAALLHNYFNNRQKDVNDIRTAIRKIREKGDELVTIMCEFDGGRFVRDLLSVMGPYIEILYECLTKSSHKDPKLFGRCVLSICMEVAIADMPYQFESILRKKAIGRQRSSRRDSRKNSMQASRRGSVMQRLSVLDGPQYSGHATPKAGGRRASQAMAAQQDEEQAEIEEKVEEARYESNKLVLLNLLNPRDLKEYMAERYKVERAVLEQTIDGKQGKADSGGSQNDDFEQTLARMKVFAFETAKTIANRKVEDPYLGSYDKDKVQFEKDLYSDFVTVRSQCFRRNAQFTKSSLNTLGKYAAELFNPSNLDEYKHKIRELEELKYGEGDETRINVRHDVYNTDRFQKVHKCPECSLMHPYVKQLETLKDAAKADKKSSIVAQSKRILEEEFRLPTEDCLALWSVLNEPDIKILIETRAGATAWKEVQAKLQELVTRYKQGLERDDARSDRYLQADKDFRQFRNACRPDDEKRSAHQQKRVLVYFGSETTHFVEGKTMEPIDVFQHLTQMSTQLQVENLANSNKASSVDTVLQHLAEENKQLVTIDELMTEEYRQLKSDTPNKSAITEDKLKQLTQLERELLRPEVIEPQIGELHVYIDTMGEFVQYSYGNLISKGVLQKVQTDPSNFSCWTLSCLTLPCCVAAKPKDESNLAIFLTRLNFAFSTGTEEHHLVDFLLIHQNGSKLYTTRFDLHALAKDGETFSFVYEPRGAKVEIDDRVDFVFDQKNLYQFLRGLSRPRIHKKGAGMGDVTGLDLLGWDSEKFK